MSLRWLFRRFLCIFFVFLTLSQGAFAGSFAGSYSLEAPLTATRGNGMDVAIGDLIVCLRVRTKPTELISLSISMPDSGQVVSIKSKVHLRNDRKVAFRFDDDGWGNSGVGTLQRKGEAIELTIEQTGGQPDANKNVRRNYGTYLLTKRSCR
nr:hypothetical protein [uncultured Duganella sp.]